MMSEAPILRIQKHNEPLRARMEELGNTLVHKDGKTFFRDSDKNFVPYSAGYITGPTSFSRRGLEDGFYISVCQHDGSWAQRDFKAGQIAQATEWALENANKALNKS